MITVFLPCRSGSERVPEKNTKIFAGVDGGLLRIKLEQLVKIKSVDQIILSTNDPKVINIGNNFSKKVIIDKRPEELALAKVRLPDGAVKLFELEAQDLNTINNGSIDVVLCHWALTLMNPIAPVLDEIHRILSAGGRFAALVDGPMHLASGYTEVHDLIYKYVQAELPSYGKVDLGDPRIRGTDSLSQLVSAAFPNAKVTVETNVVSLEGSPSELAETAAGFFYAAFTLPAKTRRAMLSELSDLITSLKRSENAAENARFSMPINRLLVSPSTK